MLFRGAATFFGGAGSPGALLSGAPQAKQNLLLSALESKILLVRSVHLGQCVCLLAAGRREKNKGVAFAFLAAKRRCGDIEKSPDGGGNGTKHRADIIDDGRGPVGGHMGRLAYMRSRPIPKKQDILGNHFQTGPQGGGVVFFYM